MDASNAINTDKPLPTTEDSFQQVIGFFYCLGWLMSQLIGAKWLPDPIDICKANATTQIET